MLHELPEEIERVVFVELALLSLLLDEYFTLSLAHYILEIVGKLFIRLEVELKALSHDLNALGRQLGPSRECYPQSTKRSLMQDIRTAE